jgi:hypothetical protein
MSQDEQEKKNNQGNECMPPYCHRAWRREMRHRHPWHGIIWGGFLVLLGLGFLAANLFNINMSVFWPVILVLVGVAIMSKFFIYNRHND